MKQRKIIVITFGVIALLAVSSVTVFFAYRTLSTTGQDAVGMMTEEELNGLRLLTSIKPTMKPEQVYEKLGQPTEDLYLVAKWNGFSGSSLSQVRMYFSDGHPRKVRWIKIGFFAYEKNF